MIKKNILILFYIDGKYAMFSANVSRPSKVGEKFMLPDGRRVEVDKIEKCTERNFDLHCKVIPRKRIDEQ